MESIYDFKPLYQKGLDVIGEASDVKWENGCYPYTLEVGQNFNNGRKILIVGKCVNGWRKGIEEKELRNAAARTDFINLIFNPNNGLPENEQIVNNPNQMRWIVNYWDNPNENGYKTKRSQYWHFIKNIVNNVEPNSNDENWVDYIAITDLYKFAPKEGNPSSKQKNSQLEICKKILLEEIDFIQPNIVIFLTTESWAEPFLQNIREHYAVNNEYSESFTNESKTTNYPIRVLESDSTKFIIGPHPQNTPRAYVETMLNCINR